MPANVTKVAAWQGFCLACTSDERPLTLLETGGRGLRAWLAGTGADDRTLALTCAVCGHLEPIFATEAEDDAYDATLARWPDSALQEVLADVWEAYDPQPIFAPAMSTPTIDLPTPAPFSLLPVHVVQPPVALPVPVPVSVPVPVPVGVPTRRRVVTTVRLAAPRVSPTDAFPLALPMRIPAAA